MRGFTKSKKKHMLKISAVYLIEKAEIPIHYTSWGQVEQALLVLMSLRLNQIFKWLFQTFISFPWAYLSSFKLRKKEKDIFLRTFLRPNWWLAKTFGGWSQGRLPQTFGIGRLYLDLVILCFISITVLTSGLKFRSHW